MAQIQVISMNTSILDYFWLTNGLGNNGESYRRALLNEFIQKLHKSLNNININRKSQIKWVISDDSHKLIKDYAQELNNANNESYH